MYVVSETKTESFEWNFWSYPIFDDSALIHTKFIQLEHHVVIKLRYQILWRMAKYTYGKMIIKVEIYLETKLIWYF